MSCSPYNSLSAHSDVGCVFLITSCMGPTGFSVGNYPPELTETKKNKKSAFDDPKTICGYVSE